MTFINEYIPEEDFEKYKLKEIDSNYHPGTKSRDWTIDREREIFLRQVSSGREEYAHETWWTFYWHGELLSLQIDYITSSGDVNGPQLSYKKLRRIAPFNNHELPSHLLDRLDEIVADLKEALTIYKDGGVFSTASDYTLTLDVDLI